MQDPGEAAGGRCLQRSVKEQVNSLVRSDLAASTTNVTCPRQINHPPPFTTPADYPKPTGGQAIVAVYCGTSLNCTGSVTQSYRAEVDVYIYYGFNDLNLFGGKITLSGSSKTTTSW